MPLSGKTSVDLGSDVAGAMAENEPVVALESTIVCHGMPYPQNVETAMEMQRAVRAGGATPALVAVLDGRLTAGLTDGQVEWLGREGGAISKASRRDLPFLIANGESGATTVAATMLIAAMAGIRVFATGGIGGVHRGFADSMDVSADLEELGRTDVAVVCAGIKSVLDVPKTLEYLETQGVPVIGYGTDTLPDFYTQSSGLPVDRRIDTPDGVARTMHAKWSLGLSGGIVVGVPVPAGAALDQPRIDSVIEDALAQSRRAGVVGKAITPFLLQHVAENTDGDSLKANIALAINNARVAAEIAAADRGLATD